MCRNEPCNLLAPHSELRLGDMYTVIILPQRVLIQHFSIRYRLLIQLFYHYFTKWKKTSRAQIQNLGARESWITFKGPLKRKQFWRPNSAFGRQKKFDNIWRFIAIVCMKLYTWRPNLKVLNQSMELRQLCGATQALPKRTKVQSNWC